MTTLKKNRQFVILTLFAMILVVAGHSGMNDEFKTLWIRRWIYSFHMPLFFLISGYIFSLTTPEKKLRAMSYIGFIKKKAVRLLIPFLFVNTAIFIIKATLIGDKEMMQHPTTLSIDDFIHTTLFAPQGYLWFLPALFMIFLFVFILYRVLRKNYSGGSGYAIGIGVAVIVFSVLSVTLPTVQFMQIFQAIYYMTYFLIGMLYQEYSDPVNKFLKKYWLVIVPVFMALSFGLVFEGFIGTMCGLIFSVTLALVLEEKCPDWIVKYSALTFTIFLLSYFPQMLVRGPIAHRFPHVHPYILSLISFLTGLLIPVVIGAVALRYKNRFKVLDRLLLLIGL